MENIDWSKVKYDGTNIIVDNIKLNETNKNTFYSFYKDNRDKDESFDEFITRMKNLQ